MAVRFSGFATKTGTLDASTKIVGYDDPAGTKENVQFSLATLVANVPSIYDTDSSLTSTRTVTHNGYSLIWDLGSNSHTFKTSSSSGTFMNFQISGSQKGAILGVSGGGGMYFRDSGGSDYYSVNQNGFYVDRNSGFGTTAQANQRVTIKGDDDLNANTALLVENNSGTDLFFLRNGGAFGLGSSATNTSETNVCIGIEAATPSVYGVAIGRKTSIGGTASYATVIGNQSSTNGAQSVVVGAYSLVGFKGATLGYGAGSASNYAVNIGNAANGSGVSSITLNANSGSATPSTVNAFGVYMSSNTTPDFRIAHDGDSYITGEGKFGIGRSNITATLDVTHYDATRKLASFSDNSQTEVFSIANNGDTLISGNAEINGQAWGDLYDGGTIADGGTFTPDWNNGNVQKIVIATGAAITIANGTNVNNGATYILIMEQQGAGGVPTFASKYRFPAGATFAPTSGAGKADVVTMIPYNATSVLCSSTLDFLTT